MEALECEGSVLLEMASFTLLFVSAVREADHLCRTGGEPTRSTDHALWSSASLWEAQTALLKPAK